MSGRPAQNVRVPNWKSRSASLPRIQPLRNFPWPNPRLASVAGRNANAVVSLKINEPFNRIEK